MLPGPSLVSCKPADGDAVFTGEVAVSECKFKAGDRVLFRFCDLEPRESTVEFVEFTGSVNIVWVVDPESTNEPYACFERECELVAP